MSLYKPGRPTEVKPLDPSNTRKVPSAKGEYRIINSGTREVVYVGVSKDLNRRMHDHIRSGKLSGDNSIFAYKQADGRASQARINDHERSKIEQHKPELNQRAGGAGTEPEDALIEALREKIRLAEERT